MTARRLLLAAGAVLLAASPLGAHSLLLHAVPAPASRLPAPPARVVLRFNNRIEKPLSGLRLVDSRGRALALVPSADGRADEMVAPVPPLEADAYRLEWHVLSTDGHVVRGAYSFRIAPAGPRP